MRVADAEAVTDCIGGRTWRGQRREPILTDKAQSHGAIARKVLLVHLSGAPQRWAEEHREGHIEMLLKRIPDKEDLVVLEPLAQRWDACWAQAALTFMWLVGEGRPARGPVCTAKLRRPASIRPPIVRYAKATGVVDIGAVRSFQCAAPDVVSPGTASSSLSAQACVHSAPIFFISHSIRQV
eukprot:2641958-Prymnesium_polylepis.2